MEEYDIKKTAVSKVQGDGLKGIIAGMFPEFTAEGEKYLIRYGALQPMTVWLNGKKLCVDIVTDKNVDNETALKSISMRNKFLEAATGFNAKERLKRLKKGDG